MDSSQKKKHTWLITLLKCSPSLTMRRMKIKTTLRFHFLPVRMAIAKKINDNPKTW